MHAARCTAKKRSCFEKANNSVEPPEVTFLHVPPRPAPSLPPSQSHASSWSQPIDLTQDSPAAPAIGTFPSDDGARPIPLHPHVYSNGIICLDLLSNVGWSPVQSVESVCMSLQSMLTGNTKAERPEGDAQFCASMGVRGPDGRFGEKRNAWGRTGRSLKNVTFMYDDDTV